MTAKATITNDTVLVSFSDDAIDRTETFEIVADYDLEGDPIGFEAFDFKRPPLRQPIRQIDPYFKATHDSESNALAVWFKKTNSSDQETLDAEFGFSNGGLLVFAKYTYLRGEAARKHSNVK